MRGAIAGKCHMNVTSMRHFFGMNGLSLDRRGRRAIMDDVRERAMSPSSPHHRRLARGWMCLGGVTALIVAASLGSSARADIIFEQLPQRTAGFAGDLDYYDDSGNRFWQQAADDFRLSSDEIIRRISWYGFYGGTFSGSVNPPSGQENMRVRVYSARPSDGRPGLVLYEESYLNPSRASTGMNVVSGGQHPEYFFTSDLTTPFSAAAATTYWLEIVQLDDVSSHFRWESSASSGAPLAYMNPNVTDWTLTTFNGNLAFQLSTVPEPAALRLLLSPLFAAAIGYRRPRRQFSRERGNRLTRTKLLVTAALIFAARATPARADIIFDQPPTRVGGSAGDLDFYTDSGQEFWQQAADDFTLTSEVVIRRLNWYGFYGGTFSGSVNPPSGSETMRVRVYSARPSDGLPGLVQYEESFHNPSRAATGMNVVVGGLHPEYYYTADLTTPFAASANTAYWLEVAQADDVDSHFRWEYAQGNATPFAFINPSLSDWTSYPQGSGANFAFQLSTIPEPTTLLLSCLGLFVATMGYRRPSRRRN